MTDASIDSALPQRTLSNRHIQFIAIGGAIGAGLFLGSGASIAGAGPAVLLAYAICGTFIFLMSRALGELILAEPAADAYATYAREYIGPTAGFVTGWSYLASWILLGAAELTATGLFVRYWFPHFPQWITVLAMLAGVYLANIRAVRIFGEVEFWLALVKIVAILLLVGCGFAVLLLPSVFPVTGASFGNLFEYGGFFPNGVAGMTHILPIALFAFGGVEVIALTAREAHDPERSIPRALNGVVLRILIFYIGSMIVAMSIAPWTSYSANESPFVAIFTKMGFPAAASAINFVVLTAVISSCNTGLFATGRMLAGLAQRGQAPQALGMLDRRGLPHRALTVAGVCLLGVVVLNWSIPDKAFSILMAAIAYLLLWVWFVIMIAHRGLRRRNSGLPAHGFRLPLYPWTNWTAIAFIGFATILLAVDISNWPATVLAAAWYTGITIVGFVRRTPAVPPLQAD